MDSNETPTNPAQNLQTSTGFTSHKVGEGIQWISIELYAANLRTLGKNFAVQIKEFTDYVKKCEHMAVEDVGEEIANSMLAYRHAEDAVMRLGKVIQAYHGGENIYDKK